MCTTLIVSAIVFNSLSNVPLQHPERVLSHFLLREVVSDNFLDEFADVFVALRKVLIKLVAYHGSKLFPLLDSLSFFDCGVQFSTLTAALGLCVVLNPAHLSYIIYQ